MKIGIYGVAYVKINAKWPLQLAWPLAIFSNKLLYSKSFNFSWRIMLHFSETVFFCSCSSLQRCIYVNVYLPEKCWCFRISDLKIDLYRNSTYSKFQWTKIQKIDEFRVIYLYSWKFIRRLFSRNNSISTIFGSVNMPNCHACWYVEWLYDALTAHGANYESTTCLLAIQVVHHIRNVNFIEFLAVLLYPYQTL